MISIKIILFVETLFLVWLSLRMNKDMFSPVKIYLLFSTFFYLSIYFQDVKIETLLSYFLLIQSIALCQYLEWKRVKFSIYITDINIGLLRKIIWFLSIPGIVTMIFFISESGGIWEYMLTLNLRVESWRGQGHFIVLLNTLPTLNLIYFASILVDDKKNKSDILLYISHFLIFFMMGLLTGSRSYIGISLVGMYVMWSYIVRPQKIIYIALVSIFLIFFVGVIGAVRNNYSEVLDDGWLASVFSGDKFESSQMAYGVNPLEIIFGASNTIYGVSESVFLGGSTYLSLLTNWMPRAIFPWKLDTGGIIFTKVYTGDHWEGLSILSPGAVAEAIMNFGEPVGVVFGVVLNFIFLLWGCMLYNRIIIESEKQSGAINLIFIVAYFYSLMAFARFSYGEFTDVFQSLIFFNLLPLALINIGLRFK